MNQFRAATFLLSATLSFLVCCVDLRAQEQSSTPTPVEKKPDIAGDWVSASPLDYFVQDESPQPVNSFRIDRSDSTFQARYLGSQATGVALKWVEESRQFEGTKEMGRGGKVTFIVKPTKDPDVLKCEIQSEFNLNLKEKSHKDTWTRARGEPKAPKLKENTEPKEGKPVPSADQVQTPILRYEEHAELTPKMKSETEELLVVYVESLKKLGFELEKGQVILRVQPGMNNAHYYPNNRSIVMDPRVVGDKTVIRREYNHHALAVALGDDAKEIFEKCSGIESALADYFGCSSCDDPIVGREFAQALGMARGNTPYLRTMDNQKFFTGVSDASGRHAVGEVVSGALWEMRRTLGKDVLDPLLYKSWVAIVKTDDGLGQIFRFAVSLMDVAEHEKPEYAKKIRAIFERRGLELP